MNNMRLANNGELRAKAILRKHFTNVHQLHVNQGAQSGTPFDFTGIDRLTSERVAIEVKTIRHETGKLVHIETSSMQRKLNFLNDTNRKDIVMVIIINGNIHFYFSKLQQHISKGALIEII